MLETRCHLPTMELHLKADLKHMTISNSWQPFVLIHLSLYMLALPFKKSTIALYGILLELAAKITSLETIREIHIVMKSTQNIIHTSVKNIEVVKQIFIPLQPFT